MRRLLAGLFLLVMLALAAPTPASAVGLPEGWTRGFNYTAWWQDGYSTAAAQASLDALATTGANEISLFPAWYMASKSSSTVAPDSQRTPTDASLGVAVQRAKAKGLRVMLRPSVDPLDGTSRLYLAPSSPSTWFASYRTMINHYADLATRLGVDSLSLGLEFQSLTVPAYESYWRSIIADVRTRFRGPITYGAAMNEYEQITWWDALDFIGIDAYFQLSNGATPSEDQVVANWHSFTDEYGRTHRYVDEISAVQARFGKPVMFTELGYRSALNVLVDPWNKGGTYSAIDQQIAISAAFRAFLDKPWFKGVHLWHWFAQDPNAGGPGDTDLTPQNKPAQQTITDWFKGPAPGTTAPPTPEPEPEPTPPPPPANAAPSVQLQSPTEGQTFSSTLSLAATASDDNAVSSVRFAIDGKVLATDTTAPYTHSYRAPKKLSYGPHTITATATDAQGLNATASVSVIRARATATTLTASSGSKAASASRAGRAVRLSGRVRGARGGRVQLLLSPVRAAGASPRAAKTIVARLRGGRFATVVRVKGTMRAVARFTGAGSAAPSRSAPRLLRG